MISTKPILDQTSGFINQNSIDALQPAAEKCWKMLLEKSGKGNDFLGWLDLPDSISESVLKAIEEDANRIRSHSSVLVVIGIGGSYLGARAVIEALSGHFAYVSGNNTGTRVIYAGHHISEDYMSDLIEWLGGVDYSLCVISKSGTTTEPAIAFRILRENLIKKYGYHESSRRIIAITDEKRGALKKLAEKEGYSTYVIPDDVGGRYSVLTPVGLLPIAVAGFDIRKLLEGARNMAKVNNNSPEFLRNPMTLYAVIRNLLYQKGKTIEILANFEPALAYFTEWWKQLFGESEGKELKGIFPAGVNNTTDLHSMGQYIQEGARNLFETVISVDKPKKTLIIKPAEDDSDGLNYLAGKRIHEVNEMAMLGTILAHSDGDVPVIRIAVPELSESTMGELIYFFEASCALSGYLLDVNPFDQPGVEAYKKNMFALLGKPGFEKENEELKKRMNN